MAFPCVRDVKTLERGQPPEVDRVCRGWCVRSARHSQTAGTQPPSILESFLRSTVFLR